VCVERSTLRSSGNSGNGHRHSAVVRPLMALPVARHSRQRAAVHCHPAPRLQLRYGAAAAAVRGRPPIRSTTQFPPPPPSRLPRWQLWHHHGDRSPVYNPVDIHGVNLSRPDDSMYYYVIYSQCAAKLYHLL